MPQQNQSVLHLVGATSSSQQGYHYADISQESYRGIANTKLAFGFDAIPQRCGISFLLTTPNPLQVLEPVNPVWISAFEVV